MKVIIKLDEKREAETKRFDALLKEIKSKGEKDVDRAKALGLSTTNYRRLMSYLRKSYRAIKYGDYSDNYIDNKIYDYSDPVGMWKVVRTIDEHKKGASE